MFFDRDFFITTYVIGQKSKVLNSFIIDEEIRVNSVIKWSICFAKRKWLVFGIFNLDS